MVLYSIGHQLYRFCCCFLIRMNSSSQTWDTDHIIFASTQLGDEYSTGTCSTSNVEKCLEVTLREIFEATMESRMLVETSRNSLPWSWDGQNGN